MLVTDLFYKAVPNYRELKIALATSFQTRWASDIVAIKEWQGRPNDVEMIVVRNLAFSIVVPGNTQPENNMISWQNHIKPSLPWAEDHFQERVSGEPLNPAPSYQWWPYYKQPEDWEIDGDHTFSHTYPERINTDHIKGIRYHYGNLSDVLDLLCKNPKTRQAYLPIWFPEDTGAVHGERVPCSIGYLFTCKEVEAPREDEKGLFYEMDIHYNLRSCDFVRHFDNDMYMAGRLLQWVCQVLNEVSDYHFKPHHLNVNIANLHIFKGEENFLDVYSK